MRVISGTLKGRVIKGYDIEGTRPTMDRVKESLFAIIQNKIKDAICLDLFAGSGNLGIESISNGSKYCYLNDINRNCIKVINENVKTFNIQDKVQIINKKWEDCLKHLKEQDVKLDLIFLDPPYKDECLNNVIEKITNYNLLNNNGLIICEVSSNYINEFDNLEELTTRKYGDKTVIILKNK